MRRRDRAALVLVGICMAWAVFAVASAPRWAACITAALCAVTVIPYVTSRRKTLEVSPLLLLIGLAFGFTLLQIVPLPQQLVAVLSPEKHALLMDNARALLHQPTYLGLAPPLFMQLSYDPPATLVELAKLGGYAVFAYACLRLSSSKRGRLMIAGLVAATGGIVAVTALLHEAMGFARLYGLYAPVQEPPPQLLAPFLNENHLAAFMALTIPVTLSLAVVSETRWRMIWTAAAVTCAIVAVLSGSRGGLAATAIGVAVAVALYVAQRGRTMSEIPRRRPGSVTIPAAVVGLCLIVIAGFIALDRTRYVTAADELGNPNSKLDVWRSSAALLHDHRWAGVGRGAFEPAFTRVQRSFDKSFSHVENEYLQAPLDWGVPAATALGLALLFVGAHVWRRWRVGPLEAGSIGALTAILVQNIVDFSLQLPGMVLPALGLVAVGAAQKNGRHSAKEGQRHVVMRSVAVACVVVLAGVALSPIGRTAKAEADAMSPGVELDERVAAWERHPSDFALAGHVAADLFARRDARAISVVNRALYMHPRNSSLHHLAARMLVRTERKEQALIEYALALRNAPSRDGILDELVSAFPDPQVAARGLPLERPMIVRVLLRELALRGEHQIVRHYGRRILDSSIQDVHTPKVLAQVALAGGAAELAVEAAEVAYERVRGPETALLLTRALRRVERPHEALEVLRAAKQGARLDGADRFSFLVEVAKIHYTLHELREARDYLTQALDVPGIEDGKRASTHKLRARIERALGNEHQADWDLDKARALDPASADNGP